MTARQQTNQQALAVLQDQVSFYISNPEKAGEALAFVKKLKDLSSKIEESVKDRAWSIMERQGLRQLEYGDYVAKLVEPTEKKIYRPSSVLKALGPDAIDDLFTVSTPSVMKHLSKFAIEGAALDQLNDGIETKPVKGYISVSEKKGSNVR